MATSLSVTEHERRLRLFPCAVSAMYPVTLHHCHSGSLLSAGWLVGKGQRQNPFLQLPLHEIYHTGKFGIDSGMGVVTWEGKFATQMELLEWVDDQLARWDSPSIWLLAKEWESVHRSKSMRI